MHQIRHVASGRCTLAAEVSGRGSPVIFLHANVCDRRMWSAQFEAVSAGSTAISYDRRGFGKTDAEAEAFSSVADLMAVADTLSDGSPAILIGCSQGGKIAIDAALRHPSRVRGLVLVAASVGGAPEPAYTPDMVEVLTRQKDAEDAGDLDAVNAIKARLWLDGALAHEGRVTGQARQLFLQMNGLALRSPHVGRNLDVSAAYGRLSEIAAPSLVMCGDLDFPHIQERSRHIADELPNASFWKLPGAAHLPSLEPQDRVTGPLLTFVQRLSGAQPARSP